MYFDTSISCINRYAITLRLHIIIMDLCECVCKTIEEVTSYNKFNKLIKQIHDH